MHVHVLGGEPVNINMYVRSAPFYEETENSQRTVACMSNLK